MTDGQTLSLAQFVSLTDEAIVVLDLSTQTLRYASPRALNLLGAARDNLDTLRITDLFASDDGHLERFLSAAATVSSPLVARVQRQSDKAQLIAKGRRLLVPDASRVVILSLSSNSELSHRFRMLAEQIARLGAEIEQRKAAERTLSENATTRERTLIAVRHMSEIDSRDPAYLENGLDVLHVASDSTGALIVGTTEGKPRILAAAGQMADSFTVGTLLNLPAGVASLQKSSGTMRIDLLRAALGLPARQSSDMTDLAVWPLYVGDAAQAFLIMPGIGSDRSETDILIEALASLMTRAKVEADLRHAYKLQAIGELTGGIAHDFNNILSIVLGNAELILDDVPSGEPVEEELVAAIRDAALRGATLTSRLLSFARKQPLRPESRSLNTVLRDLDVLLRRAVGGAIAIEMIGSGGLWDTRVDQNQLENAVLNLVLNARDAMPDGGRLTIETANARLDAEYAAQETEVLPGQYVMLAVTDTGVGMTSDVVREAFTPFFTTKGVGKGSGLGLSMTFGFVKQSGGHIKIYSEVAHGTTIKMYFPRDMTNVGMEGGGVETRADHALKAHGHILLVEDDPAILRYAARTLTLLGYSVDTALTGEIAAELLNATAYNILLTDVVLPGKLNGARVARLAKQLQPAIKVLFMSGYTENAIVHNGQLDPGVELITKPFTRDQLARRLDRLTSS